MLFAILCGRTVHQVQVLKPLNVGNAGSNPISCVNVHFFLLC
jgi:hypothetical protein